MGPYTRLEGPEKLTFPDRPHMHVYSQESYLAWHMYSLLYSSIHRWTTRNAVLAEVEHGRWLARCLNCGTGMLTRPDWNLACCSNCGGVHEHVVFPQLHSMITEVLLERPVRDQQNWKPGETVQDLKRENHEHADEIMRFKLLQEGTP